MRCRVFSSFPAPNPRCQWYPQPSDDQNHNVSRCARCPLGGKIALLWTYLCFLPSGLKGTDKINGGGICEEGQWGWDEHRERDTLFMAGSRHPMRPALCIIWVTPKLVPLPSAVYMSFLGLL